MKYEKLITDIMRLVYNNNPEKREELLEQIERDLPDELPKATQESIIKELNKKVEEYIRENSNYRSSGLPSRIKYKVEFPELPSQDIFFRLNDLVLLEPNNPFLQQVVRRVELSAIKEELNLIKEARTTYARKKSTPYPFTSNLFLQELFLKGLREKIRILDRIEKSQIYSDGLEENKFLSEQAKTKIKKVEKVRREYLNAQLNYQNSWTQYNMAILQNELLQSNGEKPINSSEKIDNLHYDTDYRRIEVDKKEAKLSYITGEITKEDYQSIIERKEIQQQALKSTYNQKKLFKK